MSLSEEYTAIFHEYMAELLPKIPKESIIVKKIIFMPSQNTIVATILFSLTNNAIIWRIGKTYVDSYWQQFCPGLHFLNIYTSDTYKPIHNNSELKKIAGQTRVYKLRIAELEQKIAKMHTKMAKMCQYVDILEHSPDPGPKYLAAKEHFENTQKE